LNDRARCRAIFICFPVAARLLAVGIEAFAPVLGLLHRV
jgi:hypothetical protein